MQVIGIFDTLLVIAYHFSLFVLSKKRAMLKVIISEATAAYHTASAPNTMGMEKIHRAFITIPRLAAMIFACAVCFVEKSSAVRIRLKPIGTKENAKTGSAVYITNDNGFQFFHVFFT